MHTMPYLIAAVVAVSLLGSASCAKNPAPDSQASATRAKVGHEISGFNGATKPYQVRLHVSLASLRRKAPGTPRFGEYAYITQLPKPVERRRPEYPDSARVHGVSGQVIVEALVLPDGTVGETWIIKSIPELDEAAARAVQHWRFTPALDGDKTTAVWIALPVDFTLP